MGAKSCSQAAYLIKQKIKQLDDHYFFGGEKILEIFLFLIIYMNKIRRRIIQNSKYLS